MYVSPVYYLLWFILLGDEGWMPWPAGTTDAEMQRYYRSRIRTWAKPFVRVKLRKVEAELRGEAV